MISSKDNDKIPEATTNHSDFSIDHILNRAGSRNDNNSEMANRNSVLDTFSWLQCTRYCPPKVPRASRREGPQKRQLGRHPRIPFTSYQLSILEEKFQQSPYLSSEEVILLSQKLQLADVRVKIWFQNRRARERREKSSTQNNSDSEENKEVNIKGPICSLESRLLIKQEESTSPPGASSSGLSFASYNFLGTATSTMSSALQNCYFPIVNSQQYLPNLDTRLRDNNPDK